MEVEFKFETKEDRDKFMNMVDDKFSKDVYNLGNPTKTVHYLGYGESNNLLARADLDKVTSVTDVRQLAEILGGEVVKD
ncbi:MAG: hypothetical protein J6U95_06400 [Alistipes sp.]|nr:hypothetical protein [Alistipes sp.]